MSGVEVEERLYTPPDEPPTTLRWTHPGGVFTGVSGLIIGPAYGRLVLAGPPLTPDDRLIVTIDQVDPVTEAVTSLGVHVLTRGEPLRRLLSLAGQTVRGVRAGETPHLRRRRIENGESVVVPLSGVVFIPPERLRVSVRAQQGTEPPAGDYELKLDGAIK